MNHPKSKLIPILIALLSAVVVAAAAIVWLLPSQPAPNGDLLVSDTQPSYSSSAALNVMLFDRRAYQHLNLQVINNGSLPVQPPAAAGKANPFL